MITYIGRDGAPEAMNVPALICDACRERVVDIGKIGTLVPELIRPPVVVPDSLCPMQEPPNEGPDDWYFDEHSQRWGRHSGRARWRRILTERRVQRAAHPEVGDRWRREFLERLGLDPDRPRLTIPGVRRNGYPEGMRRPEVELSDTAAAFVEQHRNLAETLAGHAGDRSADTPEVINLRTRVRTRIREQLATFDPDQARADGDAFLARYSLR